MQPELQVTDRVAAQVLQLRHTTHDNIANDLLVFFSALLSHGLIAGSFFFFSLKNKSEQIVSARRARRLRLLLP